MRDADEPALAALPGSRFPVIVIEAPGEARAPGHDLSTGRLPDD